MPCDDIVKINMAFKTEAQLDRALGSLIGYAIGDCLGAPYEFISSRIPIVSTTFQASVFGHLPGKGTDDTEMALCAARAILESAGAGSAPTLYLTNLAAWADTGPLDIGNQTSRAVAAWPRKLQTDDAALGNGSLFSAHVCAALDCPEYASSLAGTTHPSQIARRYAGTLSRLCHQAIVTGDLAEVDPETLVPIENAHHINIGNCRLAFSIAYTAAYGSTLDDGPLDALRWAISLGGDTDSNGAVAGGLIGAIHGMEAWKDIDLSKLETYETWKEILNRA
jgi:ADP-ribosylglycohydrolase